MNSHIKECASNKLFIYYGFEKTMRSNTEKKFKVHMLHKVTLFLHPKLKSLKQLKNEDNKN